MKKILRTASSTNSTYKIHQMPKHFAPKMPKNLPMQIQFSLSISNSQEREKSLK